MTDNARTVLSASIQRNKGGRPKGARVPKGILSLRVDVEIIERLRASGEGWQKRVNDILRKEVGL